MVAEANRIVKENRYTLLDRGSRTKSIEIFKVIQDYYNPSYDIQKACKVWNPKSKISYHDALEKKYNEPLNK